jgi:hypothetical protein
MVKRKPIKTATALLDPGKSIGHHYNALTRCGKRMNWDMRVDDIDLTYRFYQPLRKLLNSTYPKQHCAKTDLKKY